VYSSLLVTAQLAAAAALYRLIYPNPPTPPPGHPNPPPKPTQSGAGAGANSPKPTQSGVRAGAKSPKLTPLEATKSPKLTPLEGTIVGVLALTPVMLLFPTTLVGRCRLPLSNPR